MDRVNGRFLIASQFVLLLALGFSLLRLILSLSIDSQHEKTWLFIANLAAVPVDIVVGLCFSLPVLIFLLFKKRFSKQFLVFIFPFVFLSVFSVLFICVAEWLFWQEFGVRFNFIAVDYLVYTHEVIGNLNQSYPMIEIIAALCIVAIIIALFFIKKHADALLALNNVSRALALKWFVIAFATVSFFMLLPEPSYPNQQLIEISHNGPLQFISAFKNNELPYTDFYSKLKDEQACTIARNLITDANDGNFISSDVCDMHREIKAIGKPQRKNVVLISMESFSAEFSGLFGNKQNLTPAFDKVAQQGMLFTQMYATGTRTVRGLEALSLSIPPTPGQAVVRRPQYKNFATLGSILSHAGYQSQFWYGGYGYFDNMNGFFSNNGYQVHDRLDMSQYTIPHETIWGVADEVLYQASLDEANRLFSKNNPFFLHIMTTSNHRPYTYPENRIDIRSGSGRDGAVKYADWALGDFLRKAEKQPWFKETIFVIVADHCASSAGKVEIPVEKYHIPMLIYAPDFIKPQKIGTLTSQIDVAPTVLGLLNISYVSEFMGRDVLKQQQVDQGWGLVSTYQTLGFFDRGNQLVTLHPQAKIKKRAIDGTEERAIDSHDQQAQKTIALYQTASIMLKKHL